MISTREKDSKVESFVNKWLQEYYLTKVFQSSELVYDRDLQISGVDAVCDNYFYDIKAQASKKYLCNPTDTFSVEISFLNRKGEPTVGWFINPDLKTDFYMFVWIYDCTHIDGIISDINKVEVMLVDKKKLLEAVCVEYSAFNRNTLYDFGAYLRDNQIHSKFVGNLKFVCSEQLYEMPVNIILKKDYLKKFATMHTFVTKNELEQLL